tara:strand:+ start:1020 stop:3524 length:2505 start_codon:yes stop_codon:yes gene_type:complete
MATESKVNQALIESIDEYFDAGDKALDRKFGTKELPLSPREKMSPETRARLELQAMELLSQIQGNVAKIMKEGNVTIKDRMDSYLKVQELKKGLATAGTSAYARTKAASMGAYEALYKENMKLATKSIEGLTADLTPEQQTLLSGVARNAANDKWTVAAGMFTGGQNAQKLQTLSRDNYEAVLGYLTEYTGLPPSVIHKNLEKQGNWGKNEAMESVVRDWRTNTKAKTQDLDRSLLEAKKASKGMEGSAGLSGRGRAVFGELDVIGNLILSNPELLAERLGMSTTGEIPGEALSDEARQIGKNLVARLADLEADPWPDDLYDEIVSGRDMTTFLVQNGYDPEQVSLAQRQQILDRLIQRQAGKRDNESLTADAVEAIENFRTLKPGGEAPLVPEILDALIYSSKHPFRLFKEIHRQTGWYPGSNIVKKVGGLFGKEAEEVIKKGTDKAEKVVLPEEKEIEAKEPAKKVIEEVPEEPAAKTMEGTDGWATYTRLPNGNFEFIHPKTGKKITVGPNQMGPYLSIAERAFGDELNPEQMEYLQKYRAAEEKRKQGKVEPKKGEGEYTDAEKGVISFLILAARQAEAKKAKGDLSAEDEKKLRDIKIKFNLDPDEPFPMDDKDLYQKNQEGLGKKPDSKSGDLVKRAQERLQEEAKAEAKSKTGAPAVPEKKPGVVDDAGAAVVKSILDSKEAVPTEKPEGEEAAVVEESVEEAAPKPKVEAEGEPKPGPESEAKEEKTAPASAPSKPLPFQHPPDIEQKKKEQGAKLTAPPSSPKKQIGPTRFEEQKMGVAAKIAAPPNISDAQAPVDTKGGSLAKTAQMQKLLQAAQKKHQGITYG